MTPFRYLAFAALLMLLSACGFKLRSEQPLPTNIEQLWVQSEQDNSPLLRALRKRLKEYQIKSLTESPDDQAALKTIVLFLKEDNLQRRLLSLFATGQVAEYELIYEVSYWVTFPGRQARLIEFSVTREYQDDPDEALAKSRELDLVLAEMRQRAADRIIRLLPSQASQI